MVKKTIKEMISYCFFMDINVILPTYFDNIWGKKKDYFRLNLTTEGLFWNFKKHKNKFKNLVKVSDYIYEFSK